MKRHHNAWMNNLLKTLFKKNQSHGFIYLYSCMMFISYLLTRSISFDDWDSIQFALGLNEFDVLKHQPHPPGFPIYIFLGKILYFFFKDELQSLTILSSISGALTIIGFYFFIYEMFNKKIAILSSILLSLTPMFWSLSIKPLSDMPALFFLLLSLYFLYKGFRNNNHFQFYAGLLISGVSVGVRLHTIYFLIGSIIYALFKLKKNFCFTLKSFGIFVIGILIWLLPMIYFFGFENNNSAKPNYINAMTNQFKWRLDKPSVSILAKNTTLRDSTNKLYDTVHFFGSSAFGINFFRLQTEDYAIFILLFIMFFLIIKERNFKNKQFLFLLPSILLYIIVTFISLPPYNPRYWLFILPFFIILIVVGLVGLKSTIKYFRLTLLFVLIVIFSYKSVLVAFTLRTEPTPPVQVINFLNKNYQDKDIVIPINSFWEMARFLGVRLELRGDNLEIADIKNKTYGSYYPLKTKVMLAFDCEKVLTHLEIGKRVFAITTPFPGNIKNALDVHNCKYITGREIRTFNRNIKVHTKHNYISLNELFLVSEYL